MSAFAIVPRPAHLQALDGAFTLSSTTTILADEALLNEAELLRDALRPATGLALPIGGGTRSGAITLALAPALGKEAYELEVTSAGVRIAGGSEAGVFYGVQSLLQLLPSAIWRRAKVAVDWQLPAVRIADEPRFGWRGMHLDCCRHFMPREFVLKFIDLLAMHKMNTLHWHLTEDQGWRLEILKYPALTEISAWREQTVIGHHNAVPRRFDNTRHGGFYTQDDVREIVAYAAQRHITIVPEIELPGHSQAVLAAYPELGCTGQRCEVRQVWGISDEAYCAGNDATLAFLRDVLDEAMALFPGPYIHIGGDECLKKRWAACPKCQARIAAEGLEDEHGLQSWVIRQMEQHINAAGRTLIGWDEILEGGLAPNAAVMSWRGVEGGMTAARDRHPVVFTPTSHTYFDFYQSPDRFAEPLAIGGDLPLEKVYAFDPIPEALEPEFRRYVLGSQGQLWSEYMPDPKAVEYMAFPRLSALSEVVWSPLEGKDFGDFRGRLATHLERLDILDVGYRQPE